MLLTYYLFLLRLWAPYFRQIRTHQRFMRLAIAIMCCPTVKNISNALRVLGQSHKDPSPENRLFSRSQWQQHELFEPIFDQAAKKMPYYPNEPGQGRGRKYLPIGFDDTRIPKHGKRIYGAGWQRDPMGPPFQANLIWCLRFLQASILLPLYRMGCQATARAIPVAFVQVPSIKKPPKKASQAVWRAYHEEKAKRNLSSIFIGLVTHLRSMANRLGYSHLTLVAIGDGSFCNKAAFAKAIKGVVMLCRCRKDLSLCKPVEGTARRVYGREKFTPNGVLHDSSIPKKKTKIFYAGKMRTIRYKVVEKVLWQGGAQRRLLRLFVISGMPARRRTKNSPDWRHAPGYLLTSDHTIPAAHLISMYFDRWEIEVNHREEKSLMGVGDGQFQVQLSTPRWAAWIVALYSLLILSSLLAYGPRRRDGPFPPHANWQKSPSDRPTIVDLRKLFREEVLKQHSVLSRELGLNITHKSILSAAA